MTGSTKQNSTIFTNDNDEYCLDTSIWVSAKKTRKINYLKERDGFAPHIPSKKESKLLRKLMSENSMTEDQIRSHKKFRKLLSDQQNINRDENKIT